jgi:hypothetical protein
MNNQSFPESVRKTLLQRRSILEIERSKIDSEIFDIDAVLNPIVETVSSMPKASPAVFAPAQSKVSISRQIIDFAGANILPGVSLTTEKIYHLMVVNGVRFPEGKSPQARITRVLSGIGLYKGHKSKGWSLKENDPVAAGS